jgi:hypothetical protein
MPGGATMTRVRLASHVLLLALVLAVALGLLPVPVSGHTLPAGRVVSVCYGGSYVTSPR